MLRKGCFAVIRNRRRLESPCWSHTHPQVFSVVEVSPSKMLLDLHVDHKCDNVRINRLSNGIRVTITAKE